MFDTITDVFAAISILLFLAATPVSGKFVIGNSEGNDRSTTSSSQSAKSDNEKASSVADTATPTSESNKKLGDTQWTTPDDADTTDAKQYVTINGMITDHFVEGYGKDVPLSVALRMIAPEGWTVQSQNIADRSVKFQSGKNWIHWLRLWMRRFNYHAQVHGKKKTLTVKPYSHTPFRVNRGETMKETLERWGDRSGRTLKWYAQTNYPMKVSANLESSFERSLDILLAFVERHDIPLSIKPYKNVILVQSEES